MRDVEITLDKPRQLRFGIQALRDLQRVSGQPLGRFVQTLGEVSIDHLVWTIWAGLKHADANLTIEKTVPLLDRYLANGGSLPDLLTQLNDALLQTGLFTEPAVESPADPLAPPPDP